MQAWERRLAVVALVTVVVAWAVGWYRQETDLAPFLKQALPSAERFEECQTEIFAGWEAFEEEHRIVGYVAIGRADGYGGPMQVAVGVDLKGTVEGIAIVDHQETAAYFQRVTQTRLPEGLVGKKYSEPFSLGQDVDAFTGATMTVTGLVESVRSGARSVAGSQLKLPLPPAEVVPIKFGLPEITLLCLFGTALVSQAGRLKRKRLVRWICLLIGLVVLGFMFNTPLTLIHVNSLLLGYWPQWQSHLYWYVLIVGVLIVPLVTGKNPYCNAICPFGATQRCLGVIGDAKPRFSPRWRVWLRWAPRILAWAAILLALSYRNPALANYEVYGTLFDLVGSHFQFGLLAVVLVASLFITRPWCNYLCPIRAVTEYLRLGRSVGRRN
jgi:uncharacterized protein with FMN-binding domain